MGFLDRVKNLGKNVSYSVGIFLSLNSILEVIYYDNVSKKVLRSARAKINYDLFTRQINRIDIFTSTAIDLIDKLDVPSNTPVIISLPPVFINNQSLPLNLSKNEIQTVLLSDAESNYIFKKQEPVVGWYQADINELENTQEVLFAAIQANQINLIRENFKTNNINLIAIDSSYTALLRGLIDAEAIDSSILTNNWALAVITPINFITMEFRNSKVFKINEIALASKSLEKDEVLQTIVSYCNENIDYNNIENLVVVNELNDVSVEELISTLNLKIKISPVEQNHVMQKSTVKEEKQIFDDPENVFLETIGAAGWKSSNVKIAFNFLSEQIEVPKAEGVPVTIFSHTIILTTPLLEKITLFIIPVALVLVVIVYLILFAIVSSMDKNMEDLVTKKLNYQAIIAKNTASQTPQQSSSPTTNVVPAVYQQNSKFLEAFLSLAQVVPEKLWLEKFVIDNNLASTITGKSLNVDNIMDYYQSLSISGMFPNLKITSIKISGNVASNKDSNNVKIVTSDSNSVAASRISALPQLNPSSNGLPTLPTLPQVAQSATPLAAAVDNTPYYEFTFETSGATAVTAPPASGGAQPPAPAAPAPPASGSQPPLLH